jgi:hypothetical protein
MFLGKIKIRLGGLAILLASFMAGAGSPALTQDEERSNTGLERGVKAAFLYKFLGFIEWPPEAFPQPDSPFVIGVIVRLRPSWPRRRTKR